MTTWRDIGEQLRQQWLESRKPRLSEAEVDARMDAIERHPSFTLALHGHLHGDSTKLLDYLRSSRPLNAEERNDLADVLEGRFSRQPRRGAPVNRAVHVALDSAEWFYRWWLDENKRNAVADWGHRLVMKDEAIRIAMEVEGHDVDAEVVRDLMDRPKSRRK